MKAEEKTCIYVLFSCYAVCIFIGKKTTTKKQYLGMGGGRWRGTRAEGQEGKMLVADNRELQ